MAAKNIHSVCNFGTYLLYTTVYLNLNCDRLMHREQNNWKWSDGSQWTFQNWGENFRFYSNLCLFYDNLTLIIYKRNLLSMNCLRVLTHRHTQRASDQVGFNKNGLKSTPLVPLLYTSKTKTAKNLKLYTNIFFF